MSNRFTRLGVIAAAAFLAFGIGAGHSTAAETSATEALPANSVYHEQIVDAVEADLMKTPNNSVWWSSLNNGIVSVSKLADDTKAELAKGTVQAWTIPAPVAVKNVGGSVFAASAATPIPATGVTLQPGHTYLITYSAQTEASAPAAPGDPVVRPQVFPWLNENADDTFDSSEVVPGAVSASTVLPPVINRHATMSGSVVYTRPAGSDPVALQLGAHAYADDTSDAREGTFGITAATVQATLIN